MTGVALLGAGIFAKIEHLPAVEAAKDLNLLAVYSRSQASAEGLAALAKQETKPQVYYDSPASENSLDALLARADIAAVIISLPILAQPDVVRKALAAGKHVLSEKPVAPDVSAARDLVAYYDSLPAATRPIWSVAENFRYLRVVRDAAAKIKDIGGRLVGFHLVRNGFVLEDDKYYNTAWRKEPGYQGGFLLDGGVHFVAGLRFLLAAAGDEVARVASFSSLLEKRLPPVDSIHAVASTRGGVNGTISMSFGTEFKNVLEIEVVTTEGRVTWTWAPSSIVSVRRGQTDPKTDTYEPDFGVVSEVAAFAASVAAGQADPQQSPQEALKDLALLQALLESGPTGAITNVA
ncbi:uncharacterized protein SPSK_09471 [Sporothrix schenckii 1099-18]|uniref:Gfo/Idh/MocA-like oxidoreductase N-terminal domain-containing protein n=2 Tax=Sporothrix schenckii TaxID=29908 RepID=U7Q5P0_SPOS1|nr:uncharacterized protein SPSK_09471 [Sporothrix schenckii 1099-18]ERT03209.1 hypothetical protein HMPREF1624_01515 [Sporothrix schenckii ATCC 58251]KJR84369.1 hypothetical protein SPSK_09471 [Sporothrix schenckii 1099-18]